MNRKVLLTIIGFALFIIGFTSLALALVGIRWSWLAWIDQVGPLFGLLAKVVMAISGIALVAYIRMDNSEVIENSRQERS